MYSIDEIRTIQIEPSSFCNARCPGCVRNVFGYNHNTGYQERHLSLADVKTIFTPKFVSQLRAMLYNGNLGDMLMNPEIVEITAWFLEVNPMLKIEANTNGGAGHANLWKGLGRLGMQCNFALDGLEDTHHLYRQNTLWSTVIKNAQMFMAAGGRAVWKMIEFDHNRHQIDQCKIMAKELGFDELMLLGSAINRTPLIAFDQHGLFSHSLGNSGVLDPRTRVEDFIPLQVDQQKKLWQMRSSDSTPRTIDCAAKKFKDLYINSLGEVYPCCFVGHNPHTIPPEFYYSNWQMRDIMTGLKNNALERPLEQCIDWFNAIETTWQKPSVSEGGLAVCHENCAKDKHLWVLERQDHIL